MSAHTPGPWHLIPVIAKPTTALETWYEGSDCSTLEGDIASAEGELIASVPIRGKAGYSKINAYKNAAHIVRCVNAHDELVRTLEWALSRIDPQNRGEYYERAAALVASAKVQA